MTGSGQYVEVQGTGEEATFSEEQLGALLNLAKQAVGKYRRADGFSNTEGTGFELYLMTVPIDSFVCCRKCDFAQISL